MMYSYSPPQFSHKTEIKHEDFEVVMVNLLSSFTLLLSYQVTSIFQQKVSLFKWSAGKDSATYRSNKCSLNDTKYRNNFNNDKKVEYLTDPWWH